MKIKNEDDIKALIRDALRYHIVRQVTAPRHLHKELQSFYGISDWSNLEKDQGAAEKVDEMLDEAIGNGRQL